MRKAPLVLLAFAGAALFSAAEVRESFRTPSGTTVDMAYRSLQPGEPVVFIMHPDPSVVRGSVSFLGRTAGFSAASGSGSRIAFVGIDLDVKPGSYPLQVVISRRRGAPEAVDREVTIRDREFPSQRLKVAQEYVTPPRALQERIRRESEIMGWVYERITPEWLGEGGFVVPHPAEAWPNFGQRRITNDTLSSIHTGVDLRVPHGQPIRAVNAGRVVLAGNFYMPGKTVIVDHGLGVFSFYCHLSVLEVRRGDTVRKGRVIGRCGSTGRSTGPHLHWSMRIFDSRVDPHAMLELPVDR